MGFWATGGDDLYQQFDSSPKLFVLSEVTPTDCLLSFEILRYVRRCGSQNVFLVKGDNGRESKNPLCFFHLRECGSAANFLQPTYTPQRCYNIQPAPPQNTDEMGQEVLLAFFLYSTESPY